MSGLTKAFDYVKQHKSIVIIGGGAAIGGVVLLMKKKAATSTASSGAGVLTQAEAAIALSQAGILNPSQLQAQTQQTAINAQVAAAQTASGDQLAAVQSTNAVTAQQSADQLAAIQAQTAAQQAETVAQIAAQQSMNATNDATTTQMATIQEQQATQLAATQAQTLATQGQQQIAQQEIYSNAQLQAEQLLVDTPGTANFYNVNTTIGNNVAATQANISGKPTPTPAPMASYQGFQSSTYNGPPVTYGGTTYGSQPSAYGG